MPFVILPFRPVPQSGDCRNFIRSYFKSHYEGHDAFRGTNLQNDLRLTEPLVSSEAKPILYVSVCMGITDNV